MEQWVQCQLIEQAWVSSSFHAFLWYFGDPGVREGSGGGLSFEGRLIFCFKKMKDITYCRMLAESYRVALISI